MRKEEIEMKRYAMETVVGVFVVDRNNMYRIYDDKIGESDPLW